MSARELLDYIENYIADRSTDIAEVIYSEAFDNEGVGAAIMNRLLKAAGRRVI